jgi:DNA-binding MarR family transcriptional regulator
VLNHLIRVGDGPTPIKLARAFQVPKTSMTHTLKMLEKRGMVETRSNPDDGRSKQVWLTPKGRETRDQTISALAQDFSELAQGIDMEALIAIQPALTALRKHLDASRDKS